jgi:hypothetical protein
MFGLGGGTCRVVSCSVPLDTLHELAAGSPTARAVPYEDIITCGPAPGRPRSHITMWQEGRTRLNPFSDADREVLRDARGGVRPVHLVLDVQVDGARLPADPTMRGSALWGRFQSGSAQVEVPRSGPQGTVQVVWPSSWTCLAAVAQTRGLEVRESHSGLAAAALIRSLSGTTQVGWLMHHGLIALLYRMAETSGMSWWKRRWTETERQLRAQGIDSATLDKAAALLGRDDPVVAPAGEGRALPFHDFVKSLGSEAAARHWVSWAERRHLLVRGANIRCPACGASAWLPMAAIPPPVACAGCGREILHPYGPRELLFTYRLGEPLRRVLETDSLGHVLGLRWFVNLFEDRTLVGAHPGVEFVDPHTGKAVGEADVLLLFADGTLVPVEVKRRSFGVDDKKQKKIQRSMDTVAAVLSAPWDAFVVTQPARECEEMRAVERRLPDRPRLLLTTDQLFADHVIWSAGADPFGWTPFTSEQDAARDTSLGKWLRHNDPDRPWDTVSETLLDGRLGARHTRAPDRPAASDGSDEAT